MRSLVTYSAAKNLGSIPRLARQLGFDGTMVMGIWDISSDEEWENALAQRDLVDGYCLGNEGLGVRYGEDELLARMVLLRSRTSRPVTTSEPIDSYLRGPHRRWLLAHSDWLLPLAHPFWASHGDPARAVEWIVARHDLLVATSGRTVILKEAGLPSAGAPGASEEGQLAFFRALAARRIPFVFFEAFDQPWKVEALKRGAVEAHWGLYRADGSPKASARWLSEGRVGR